jgi:hypothetical protein
MNSTIAEFVALQILILGHILVGQQSLEPDVHDQTVRSTAMLNAAQKNNGVAQVIPGYLVHFLALVPYGMRDKQSTLF